MADDEGCVAYPHGKLVIAALALLRTARPFADADLRDSTGTSSERSWWDR
jgi:hypothetical protein